MCGIAGVFPINGGTGSATDRAATVQRMIRSIGYRGPDELSYVADGHAALAAARLSIIDIPLGHQPMSDRSGRYWIVYNGEIYNFPELRAVLVQRGHMFRTKSDTEVALAAWIEWGEGAPARFDGGFAFAIYDRTQRTCTLIRDRFGKRPLFYAQHRGELLFASEMKAFLEVEGFEFAWDTDQLASIFATWTPVGTQTGFRDIKQVPAGSILTFGLEALSNKKYADLPARSHTPTTDIDKAAEELRALLDDSVRKRLRSDVEVAIFVSGGLDSTIVTKLARDHMPGRVRTYSVRFDDPDFDEREDQTAVTERFGLDNTYVTVGPGTIAEHFPAALWHAEIPQFRTAFVPMYLLARKVHADGIKVVLSGEGADEIFLGYDLFKETVLRANWGALDEQSRRHRVSTLYPYLKQFSGSNLAALEAVFSRSSTRVDDPLFSHRIRFDNSGLSRRLLRGAPNGLEALSQLGLESGISALPPLHRAQWIEVHSLLSGYLLSTQSDRMLFAHGVEPRCPFLAPEVAAFAATLADTLLLTNDFGEKHILKKAFGADLPERVLNKPKWPYRAPDASSFSNGLTETGWIKDALSDQSLKKVAPLDPILAGRLRDKVIGAKQPLSQSDNQAFLQLLSLVLLDEMFVCRNGPKRFPAHARPVVEVPLQHEVG